MGLCPANTFVVVTAVSRPTSSTGWHSCLCRAASLSHASCWAAWAKRAEVALRRPYDSQRRDGGMTIPVDVQRWNDNVKRCSHKRALKPRLPRLPSLGWRLARLCSAAIVPDSGAVLQVPSTSAAEELNWGRSGTAPSYRFPAANSKLTPRLLPRQRSWLSNLLGEATFCIFGNICIAPDRLPISDGGRARGSSESSIPKGRQQRRACLLLQG